MLPISGFTQRQIFFQRFNSESAALPLVLVMGYGGSSQAWPLSFIEELAANRSVVIFDNRGTGSSQKPREASEYSIDNLVDDLYSVVHELGFETFNLLGYSLGGCISLEFAMRHSHLLSSLLIVSSTAGGRLYHSPGEEKLSALGNPQGTTLEELNKWTWELCMTPEKVNRFWPQLRATMAEKHELLTPRFALRGQLATYRSFDRAQDMSFDFPVTIIGGEQDPLTPIQNSVELSRIIAASRLVVIPDCEHIPYIDRPLDFLRIIQNSLAL